MGFCWLPITCENTWIFGKCVHCNGIYNLIFFSRICWCSFWLFELVQHAGNSCQWISLFWTGIRRPAPPIMNLASSIFAHQFIFKTVVTILCVVFNYLNWSGMWEIHSGEYRYFWTGVQHPAPLILILAPSIFAHQFNFKTVVTILCVVFGSLDWSGMLEIHAGQYRHFWTGIRHPAPPIMIPASIISIHFQNRHNYPMCSFNYLNWSGMWDIHSG